MITLILAGGKERDKGFNRPKAVTELLGRPLICYVIGNIEKLLPDTKKIIITNPEGEKYLKRLINSFTELKVQKEAKGTAHAVYVGIEDIMDEEEDLLILYADTPLFRETTLHAMIEHHRLTGHISLLCQD
ncbi:MAG TPA: hypothetical protein EYP16_02570 [Candidatus Atribacteria bacterium]|nr:hypothetical protein [Candidatus Atribacteria bacterium]